MVRSRQFEFKRPAREGQSDENNQDLQVLIGKSWYLIIWTNLGLGKLYAWYSMVLIVHVLVLRLAGQIRNLTLSDSVVVGRGNLSIKWDQMGLKTELIRGILTLGFEKPEGVQKEAIPIGLKGRDIILQAQSGMGKTLAMLVIVLQKIKIEEKNCQAIILAHTRELALQIREEVVKLGRHLGIKSFAAIGGVRRKFRDEKKLLLESGFHVIVGTLGRLLSHFNSQNPAINPKNIQIFTIDEADKMLMDPNSRKDLQNMFSMISGDAQLILMSATMPQTALDNARMVCRSPVRILLRPDQLTLEGIKQYYLNVGSYESAKLETLIEILPFLKQNWTFIFCNTREHVNKLCIALNERGISVASVEGMRTQAQRERILKQFKTGEIRALISSDLLGRGIDIQQVSVVINYELPDTQLDIANYLHRVGRAGRFGRKGVAISFIIEREVQNLEIIKSHYSTEINELPADFKKFLF